jgi:hypothetical protein
VNGRNVLITGLPRGGTTLACELLNDVPDTIALDEPMRPMAIRDVDSSGICDAVATFCEETRGSLLRDGRAITKHVEGRVFGGKVSEATGLQPREKLATREPISFDKPLSPDFVLALKHPALFTAYIDALTRRFPVFAVVRHPLAVLASWQTVPFPVRQGHLPVAERFDSLLEEQLAAIPERLDRQVALLDWMFGRYERLPEGRVLRYEDIVASRGAALGVVTENASSLDRPLMSRNRSYEAKAMRELADRLLASDGAYWRSYPRDSVSELLRD